MTAKTTTQRRLEFERWVNEAEQLIAMNPRAYRLRVGALALLGYAVLFGLLGVLVALVVGSVWAALVSSAFLLLLLKKKLILVLGLLVYVIIKALWVRIDTPSGYVLTPKSFPQLHEEITKLQKQLRTPRIHEVILTEQFNAGVTQTPRLGVFGWYKNTLILGLQLLLALSPEQARAVLAHEFGHLSGNHSRFNGWIYRVRATWYRVMEAFDRAGAWGTGVLRRFFDWYAPYFSAYSFALARANEYEADAISARLTSPATAAQALLTTNVQVSASSERYWDPLVARADSEAEPVRDPFEGLARFFRNNPIAREELLERIRKAHSQETDHADTHPAMKDRLSALDASPQVPQPPSQSAAQIWLGSRYGEVLRDFDGQWLARNEQAWKERHTHVQGIRDKLRQLSDKPIESLNAEERWQLANWTEQFAPERDALPLYEAYQQAHPADRDADHVIGRLLLARGDGRGLAHLEKALEKFSLVVPSCEVAYAWHKQRAESAHAEQWRQRAEAHMDVEHKARAERASVMPSDKLIACELPEASLQPLREQLAGLEGLKAAWICQKSVEHVPESPIYVVAYEVAGWLKRETQWIEKLSRDVAWPSDTFLVMKGGQAKQLARKAIALGTPILGVR